jgi:hypothetical protein
MNGYNGEPTNGTNGRTSNGHVENGAAMPADNGYPSNDFSTNGHNGYPTTGYPTTGAAGVAGDCNGAYPDYNLSGYFDDHGHNSQWFGGVYWLFMTRDDSDFQRLTAQFETPGAGYPYYPPSEWTVLTTSDGDHDYRNGVEVRFGSTFGCGGGHDAYGCGTPYGYGYGCNDDCGSCDVQEYAWEVGYWIIDDDVNQAQVIDSIPTDTFRMYGMKSFAGLEYNGRPVNDYYDYQMPVTDPSDPGATDVRVLAQRIRSNFRAQNLELNFLRLPLCGTAGDCGGCGVDNCAPACGSPFSVTALCGVRYLRLDDDFEYATMWAIDDGLGNVTPPAYTPWDGANELFYDIKVDNELIGFQLGANMSYAITCNCSVFWNSNFGMYNNHIDVYQRVYGQAGPATYIQDGREMTINADKDDVAFLGELLVGGSYAFNCHWRGIIAYRAIGITGVALSTDQMPENFSTLDHVTLVDANGSIIIHGVQVGAECRY